MHIKSVTLQGCSKKVSLKLLLTVPHRVNSVSFFSFFCLEESAVFSHYLVVSFNMIGFLHKRK